MEPGEDASSKPKKKEDLELTDLKEKSNTDAKKEKGDMRQGCLGLFDCFSPPDPEQTPIASSSKMEDSKRPYDSTLISELDAPCDYQDIPPSEEEKPPMGFLRKLLFVISLNGGVAFVAVLLWAIPCRVPPCKVEHGWDFNMSSLLTSNMEIVKVPGHTNSIVFCHTDAAGGHVSSLNSSDGNQLWNQTSETFCHHVFCEFGRPLEVNKKKICITTGYNFIGAIDATNGKMVWWQNSTDLSGENVYAIALSSTNGLPHLLAISEKYMYSVNAKNGTVVSVAHLPCSSSLSVKIEGPWVVQNETLWALVCLSGDTIAVWTFEEDDVLSPMEERNPGDDVGFSLLFSRESWSGSIDLAGDVTSTPESLAVAWADSVAMVTTQRLQKTWERRFDGDYLAVTSIAFGKFTDPEKMQLAVAVKERKNMTIHILDSKSGSPVAVSELGGGTVMAMKKIPGRKEETDTLFVESIKSEERRADSATHSPEQTTRSYFTMRYGMKSVMYQTLVSSDVYDSTFSSHSEGLADLLTATRSPDDSTVLRRIVITTALGPFCSADDLKNTTIVITRD